MGAAAGSYALRQSKFADRRIFVDLLRRLIRLRSLEDYIYIGLGGVSLEDHKMMYGDLGINRLVSLDRDAATVRRQRFNQPLDTIKLLCMSTKDCIDSFWRTMQEQGFPTDASVIAWLDYTSPTEIYAQLHEIQALASLLSEGDVIRITLNAHPPAYYSPPAMVTGERPPTALENQNARLERVVERLGEFAPTGITAAEMDYSGLPSVLARATHLAVLRSLGASNNRVFLPLCLLRYADGQQMLTVTGTLLGNGQADSFIDEIDLSRWEFYSPNWGDIHDINIPDLTFRERLFIDQLDVSDFDPEKTPLAIDKQPEAMRKLVQRYKRLYRHYPQFHHINY